MSDAFNDFIKKKAEIPEKKGLSLDDELRIWREKLEELYKLMRETLSESIEAGSVVVSMHDMRLHEEQLGSYKVPAAKITIGRNVVTLTPIGTFLIGARGRLDMKGPFGLVRFVIVPPDSTGIRVHVYVDGEGAGLGKTEAVAPPETWVWKIATPPPRVSYKELSSETFQSALMEVLGG